VKAYWDAGGLIEAASDLLLRTRLRQERGYTRTHALAETFSVLTGGRLAVRLEADAASQVMAGLAADLDFIDLDAGEVLSALKEAQKRGVRGGRVHDFLHARAAEKAGALELLTTDQYDFASLTDKVRVVVI
jgi:predicted nucleic acid-binding protein